MKKLVQEASLFTLPLNRITQKLLNYYSKMVQTQILKLSILVTPRQLAVKQNHTEAVELLLQYGADPNQETSRGITVLHQAVIKDKKDIAQILLKHGVN